MTKFLIFFAAESYSVTVTYKTYMESCDDSLSIFAYACAKDVKANMPYSAQKAFRLRRPDLDVEVGHVSIQAWATVGWTGQCLRHVLPWGGQANVLGMFYRGVDR